MYILWSKNYGSFSSILKRNNFDINQVLYKVNENVYVGLMVSFTDATIY